MTESEYNIVSNLAKIESALAVLRDVDCSEILREAISLLNDLEKEYYDKYSDLIEPC